MSSRSESDIEDSRLPENLFLQKDVKKLLTSTNNAFTENRGQLDNDEVRFYDQGGSVWFTDDGVWFKLREYTETRGRGSQIRGQDGVRATPQTLNSQNFYNSRIPTTTHQYKSVILKQEFAGANQVRPIGRERLSWNSNFFYENDSSKWCMNVPNYREIYYNNLYDGIDLRYYTIKSGLKYDFIVYPGAAVDQIRIRYNGSEGLEIDGFGNLIIKTPIKDIMDSDLFIYQDYAGLQYMVNGKFVIYNKSEYGFEILHDYNKNEVLVIDPNIILDYSTYIGGSYQDILSGGYLDSAGGIAVDSTGNALITGETGSLDFPTTPSANDTSYNGDEDVFIIKLNNNGSDLIYSTYIGGNNWDTGIDIAVDSTGNAFITGWTTSANFPTTSGVFDNSYNTTLNDLAVFVLKLNWNGSTLIYSTFVEGTLSDFGWGIAIDPVGNAYVTGQTYSPDFPVTPGANDTSWNSIDVFVFKLNPSGSALIYSTFVGGSKNEWGSDIALDSDGNAYITGSTESSNFPTTPGAYDPSHSGNYDCFIVKLNQNGSQLIYSTYIGGNEKERSGSLALDSIGNVLITGQTESINFPTTPNAYDRTINGGYDAFISKLRMNGSGISDLLYSTYIGGGGNEYGFDITVDLFDNIFVTGETDSSNFPTTFDAIDKFNNETDGFMFKLDPNESILIYSTYLGGNNHEWCRGIAIDLIGNTYIAGITNSSDFPTTPGAFDPTFNGGYWDVFVSKFHFRSIFNITSLSLLKENQSTNLIYSRSYPYTFRVNITDTAALTELREVNLTLDPLGLNIQLSWVRTSNQFSKRFDPYNFITLESSSKVTNNVIDRWNIDFDVTFNWTYPDEAFHDVQVYATSATLSPAWLNATNLYRVENDLVFNGTLSIRGEDNRTIDGLGLVRGGEWLNWTGLIPVYEGTADIYPPEEECNITLWDENGNSWEDSPPEGEPFYIEILTPNTTNTNGYTYTINISGIPPECDKTNETFTIMIDGNNVTFSDPTPNNTTWQTESSFIPVGITITDIGGGDVKSSSVKYSYTTDNQISWSDWKSVPGLNSDVTISPKNTILLNEGTNNFVKWRAEDSVGNGPTESETYRILVDISNVEFTNPIPLFEEESATQKVQVGITISDKISGVNGSPIEYSISSDNGTSWSSWAQVNKLDNGSYVNITLNLTFPNGTANRIKWRASDIAGNGPTESMPYKIIVNTWLQTFIPKVELFAPENGSILPTTSVELSWLLKNTDLVGVNYDIFLDTLNPPVNLIEDNFTDTTLRVTDLSDGETYYWTVIPKLGNEIGWCISGVWSFSVNTSVPYPIVQLISPENNSIITSPRPTFQWSVEYEGTEKLSYNVFLGIIENSIEFVKSSNIYYLPDNILEDNTTYYWKIIPWAGNIKGEDSEIWSFTVKRDYVPKFGINLTIDPSEIELEPGGMTVVKAKVTNLGELVDTISLSVEIPLEADVGAMVNEPISLELAPEDNGSFNITVTTTEDIKQDEIVLTIIATSEKAIEYGKTVEKREELTVKIIKENEPGKEKSDSTKNYWIYLIVIIIIIIILLIGILYLKQKKQPKQEPPSTEDAIIETTPLVTSEIPQEQLSPTPTIVQPPTISTPESEKKAITPSPSTPELPSPSTESHEATPQQIPQVQPKPQLPPAQPQTLETEANVTATVSTEQTPDLPTTQEP